MHAALSAAVSRAQAELCAALERLDGGRFTSHRWSRDGGGGGLTRVLDGGAVLEKAAVNVSDVGGEVPPALAGTLQPPPQPRSAGRKSGDKGAGPRFLAAGLSVVIHPRSPMAPTAHANVRFVACGEEGWFGGGADLTPHYLFEDDCRAFHGALRALCERHLPGRHGALKRAADDYFHLPHRNEHRGVGGIFFDRLGGEDLPAALALALDLPRTFLDAYLPIVERRLAEPWGEEERTWQEIRRGRYVEFNLILDRGTHFGLATGGRTESVLASLPPRVRWAYDHRPAPGSREAALLEVLRTPRDWA